MCEELCGRGLLLAEPPLWWWWGDGKPSPWFGDIMGVTSAPASAKALVLLTLCVNEDGTTATQKTHRREYKCILKINQWMSIFI